jgi:hypothetical protein
MEKPKNDWNDKEFRNQYMKCYNTKYYEQKREILCSKIMCSCGKMVNLSSLKRHIESKYHYNKLLDKDEYINLHKNKILNVVEY